jgi:hypothetical protein
MSEDNCKRNFELYAFLVNILSDIKIFCNVSYYYEIHGGNMIYSYGNGLSKECLCKTHPGLWAFILFAVMSSPIYAARDANLIRKAHTQYHLKPNTAVNAPSGYSPAQITHAYGIDIIPQQGAGQVIAIVDAYDNPNAEADLGVFSSTFNLAPCTTANGCFQKIYASGTQPQPDQGWAYEISLDIQWAHAIAPRARIMLVEAADNSFASLLTAISVAVQNGATIVSMSWGGGEFAGETQYDTYFNVPGVSFVASSGDGGEGVLWPAVSPYVIATGGTSLRLDAQGNYVSETAWPGSGGGISAYVALPAYQQNFANFDNPNRMRGIPDVAMVADPNTGLSVYDSYGEGGVIAIINSAGQVPQPMNAQLYNAATKAYSADYHDITQGSNGTCGPVCTAQVGYDYVTGIGSPKAANLLATLVPVQQCVRQAPTITHSPANEQVIFPGGYYFININIRNNDNASCPPSTFNLIPMTSSPLITSAMEPSSSLTMTPGSQASTNMAVIASRSVTVGQTYYSSAYIYDTVLNRSAYFVSVVMIE